MQDRSKNEDSPRKPRLRGQHVWAMVAVITLSAACTSPTHKFDVTVASLGLDRQVVVGSTLQHVVYWRYGGPNGLLHIYLDGDGTPEVAGRPAVDPTPRNALMLRLIALDPGPAIYVGRPCYHGLAETAGCSSHLWTAARYSESVVASLAAAIRKAMIAGGYAQISFFGYSGGGTLAMLLAARISETKTVVTIAANLDVDAWADLHGLDRLKDSLNPATLPPLRHGVAQRHYAGGRDRIVPVDIVRNGVRGVNAKLIVVNNNDHVCCWADMWPSILQDVSKPNR